MIYIVSFIVNFFFFLFFPLLFLFPVPSGRGYFQLFIRGVYIQVYCGKYEVSLMGFGAILFFFYPFVLFSLSFFTPSHPTA